MDSRPPLITTGRALAAIIAMAGVTALVIVVLDRAEPTDALAEPDRVVTVADRPRPPRSPDLESADPEPRYAERVEPPPIPEEDLWALVPDEHQRQEMVDREFRLAGGIDWPGRDPEGARREVDAPEWAERTEADLRRGIEERVLTRGVELHHLACRRGRCLVELSFDGMERAFERVEAIRGWLQEEVRCRAYSEGPADEESPQLPDNQQIWILCGEPTAER